MGAEGVPKLGTHPILRDVAQKLRREMTMAEQMLWQALRGRLLGVLFRRQHPIQPHVADFACVEARLVVEVDVGQHGGSADAARDAAMQAEGWEVRRYWNNEVTENLDGVLADLAQAVAQRLRR